ncbi:MAG: DEAD/DEAH box helicase [Thermoprotei archaeon]
MSQGLTSNVYTKVLEQIIFEECKRILSNQHGQNQHQQACKPSEPIELTPDRVNYAYGLTRQEIEDLIKGLKLPNPSQIFEDLIKKGLLVEYDFGPNGKYFRSVYMDLFLHSAFLRTAPFSHNYIVKPRLVLVEAVVPSEEDRVFHLDPNSNVKEIRELVNTLNKHLGEERARKFVKIVEEYLTRKKYSGLDLVQISMIRQAIESLENGKHVVIEAPTGFGKTEIFLFTILYYLLKHDFNPEKKVLLLYPRKALAVDNANRIVMLASILRELLGIEVPILLRDGESPEEASPRAGEPIRDGTIKCPNGHALRVNAGGGAACEDSSCRYSKTSLPVYDTRSYKRLDKPPLIIVSNIYTIANRLLDFGDSPDINVNDFEKIGLIIMDEMHIYTGVTGGAVSYVLEGIKTVNPDVKFVGVSATIPNREEFSAKLFGVQPSRVQSEIEFVSSKDIISSGKLSRAIIGRKLYVLGFFEIRPDISWQTYSQLWGVLASTYSIAILKQPNAQKYLYQSIVFINNVFELGRFRDGLKQNISLGEPCKDRVKDSNQLYGKTLKDVDPFYIYLPSHKYSQLCGNGNNSLGKTIEEKSTIVFMEASNKFNTFKEIAEGKYVTVGATSSLEVGVDYEGVSFILNSGADGEVEIVQRLGRASRSGAIPRITLGIILSKNVPLQSYRIHDTKYIDTIVYMLSGSAGSNKKKQEIGQRIRQELGLRILKDAKPVVEFGHLLLGTLKMYKSNPGSVSNGVSLCDFVAGLKRSIGSNEVSKSLSDFLDKVGLCNGGKGTTLDVERCRQIFEEDMEYGIRRAELKLIPNNLSSLKRRTNEALLELSKKIEELIEIKKIKRDEIPASLRDLSNSLRKLNEKFDEARILSRALLVPKVGSRLVDDFITLLGEIDRMLNDISHDLRYNVHLVKIEALKKTRDELENISSEIKKMSEQVDKYGRQSFSYRINEYEVCDKMISVLSGLDNAQDERVSPREFIFDYSSLSPSLLNVEDKGVKKVKVGFYELRGNKWSRVGPVREYDFMDALNKFPPFTVLNYENYVKSPGSEPDLPRYGIVLFPLKLKNNVWDSSIAQKITFYLSINVGKFGPTGGEVVDIDQIGEIRVYNILELNTVLNSSIRILPGSSRGDDSSRPLFLEYGIDVNTLALNQRHYSDLSSIISAIRNSAQQLRISYDPLILNYARTCGIGLALSTNTLAAKDCPFKDSCSIGLQHKRKACRYWSSRSMQQMKRTIPVVKQDLAGEIEDSSSLITPLMKISVIKSLKVYEEIDKIQVSIEDNPRFLYIRPRLVHKLHDTNGIRIELNETLIKKKLYEFLFESKRNGRRKLLEILLTKYYIALTSANNQNVYNAVKLLEYDQKDRTRYADIYNQIVNLKDKKEMENFLNFVYNVLVHTLAHKLVDFLVYKLDIEENLIDYYIHGFDLKDLSKPANSIYIFENTVFGALKLSDLISKAYNNNLSLLIQDFLLYVYDELKSHISSIKADMDYLKILKQRVLSASPQSDTAKYVRVARRRLSKLLRKNVRPDLYLFKLYLAENFGKGQNKIATELQKLGVKKPDESTLLSYADIAVGRFCVDGCSSCVMSDKCHYPIHQNLLVSRRILFAFLNLMLNAKINSLRTSVRIPKGTSDDGFALLEEFGSDEDLREVEITSAFIDKSCLERVRNVLKGNPNVKVVLWVDEQNYKKTVANLQNDINTLMKEYEGRFAFKLEKKTHKKEYVFTYSTGEKIVIDTSWNCQKSANAQNFTITKL